MPTVPNDIRDQLISAFRERICTEMGVAPFRHQREVWAASDGMVLTGGLDPSGVTVTETSGEIVRYAVEPRREGRAKFLSDLGAFKIGKSWGAAMWSAGFAAVPGSLVSLVGLEYDICAPEFNYLCEFLLSDRGMRLPYDSLQNRPRDGKMWLDLSNTARFEARSWERRETLKGKENDAYVFCEAYQLPGIDCFTGVSQNLRARRGYAYFATTPDKPWVKDLHDLGHGLDPEWHCTCSIRAEVNPFTFDQKAKDRDKNLMTREKYEIHYHGQIGSFVGRVFTYTKGSRHFTSITHPELFRGDRTDRDSLRVPPNWTIVGGADTGTFYSGLLVAFSPDGEAFVLDEFPNYRYVGGHLERDESISIPGWSWDVLNRTHQLGGRGLFWADANSQFKTELRNYDIVLLADKTPVEARTEIAREYFEHGKVYLAPWLTVLPFELENASWPPEATATGKFSRVKDRDHTLDCLEHILARRPMGNAVRVARKVGSWALSTFGRTKSETKNVHLGVS